MPQTQTHTSWQNSPHILKKHYHLWVTGVGATVTIFYLLFMSFTFYNSELTSAGVASIEPSHHLSESVKDNAIIHKLKELNKMPQKDFESKALLSFQQEHLEGEAYGVLTISHQQKTERHVIYNPQNVAFSTSQGDFTIVINYVDLEKEEIQIDIFSTEADP